MMIGHYAAIIIAHYHTSNMGAVFSGCMLEEPHTSPISYPDIYNPCFNGYNTQPE